VLSRKENFGVVYHLDVNHTVGAKFPTRGGLLLLHYITEFPRLA